MLHHVVEGVDTLVDGPREEVLWDVLLVVEDGSARVTPVVFGIDVRGLEGDGELSAGWWGRYGERGVSRFLHVQVVSPRHRRVLYPVPILRPTSVDEYLKSSST